jgi:hypothetical protein
MKKMIFTLAIAALAFTANAQSDEAGTFKYSVGVTFGLPIGDLKDASNFVYGADGQVEYIVADKIGLTGSFGYTSFPIKDGFGLTVSAFPLLVGGKYYISEKLYAQAQAGFAFLNNGAGSGFVYAPSVGYYVTEKIDLSLKYQSISKNGNISFFGLRGAYTF